MVNRSAGAFPAVLIAAGWSLLALSVVPDIRDRAALALLTSRPVLASEILRPDAAGLPIAVFALGFVALGLALGLRRVGNLALESWSRARCLITLVGSGAFVGLAMLAPGEPTIMDAKSHVARGWMFATSFRAGELPTWTDLWYTGFPADLHYPPLSHMIGGVWGLLGLDAFAAVKLTAWLCVISATTGFGILGTELHGSRRAGWIVALAGGLSPTLRTSWMWEGRLPGLLVLAILPWALLAAERLVTGRGTHRTAVSLAWAIFGLVLAHVGQARVVLQFGLAFVLVRTIAIARARPPEDLARIAPGLRSRLLYLGAGSVLGLLLSACVSIPMLREGAWVNQIDAPRLLSLKLPSPSAIASVFVWNPRGVHYVGLSIGLLAIAGIWGRPRESSPAIGSLAAAALLCIPWFLVVPESRGLDVVFVGGALAAGRVGGVFGRRGWLLASLLLVADLAPFHLQSTYSAHRGERNRAYDWLEHHLERGRLLELPADASAVVRPGHWYFAPARALPTLGGPFIQGAPLAFRFAAAAIDTVGFALRERRSLTPELQRLLAFHGVEAVLVMGPRGPLPTDADGLEPPYEDALPVRWIPDASFLHALPSEEILDSPTLPSEPIGTRGLPLPSARASAGAQLAWLARAVPEPVAARATFFPNELVLDSIDDQGGPTRIARADYPGTRVAVDGNIVPWRRGPLGGIRVDLPTGWRQLRVTTPMSPLRDAMLYTLLGLFCGSALLWAGFGFSHRERRASSRQPRRNS